MEPKIQYHNIMKKLIVSLIGMLPWMAWAQVPDGYYDNALNKSGYELKRALWQCIFRHEQLSYAELWTAFGETDVDGDGYIIDMYNDCQFEFQEDQCGSGSSGNEQDQCVCYNREHSMPKSWFDDGYPMYTDLFHLYPVSGYVNSRRSNYPFGEVKEGRATFTSTAGSQLGTCGYPGYGKTVFEPVDEYKGDFARTYFYMATCYQEKVANWKSDMLAGNNQQTFTDWAKNMLLEWHEQDPVSEKEIARNNAVYEIQGNRNPFIDYPELAEKIWGDDDTPFTGEESGAEERFWNQCSLRTSGRFLQLEYEGGLFDSVEIVDVSGRQICHSSVKQSRFAFTLPAAGAYIVRIQKGRLSTAKKISVL